MIRDRLVQSILQERDDRLALQDALVIAKIARYEYPQTWPTAISGFVEVIKAPETSPFQLARALLALIRIVKELSTARLQQSKQALQNGTPEMVAVVGNVYARIVEMWLVAPNVEQMRLSLLAIKLVRRLVVTGYESPNHDQDVVSFWSLTLQHLSSFITFRKAHADQAGAETLALLENHILQFSKLHCEMAKSNAAAFALLPNSVDLANAYWGLVKEYGALIGSQDAVSSAIASAKIGTDGDVDDRTFDEKIALKGLLLIRACVKMVFQPAHSFKHRTPEAKEEKKRATEMIRNELLNENFVRDALETIVFRLLIFRANELQKWTEEPEEWEQREDGSGDDWEFSVRPCAEKLFLDLSINYKEIVVQPLLSVIASISDSSNHDILYKDSIYSALGLSAPVLHEHFDFDAFIKNVLVTEVQRQEPGANVLRRRVAIVLGQWINVKVAAASKTLVYEIFQHLLNPEDPLNDQVVRVTAGRHFADVANDWEFRPEQFLPFATNILTRLLKLVEEVELPETKLIIVNTISIVVERLDHLIVPYAEGIVGMLPSLWEQSTDEHLMRQAILTILTRLINAMRSESLPLHSMVYPIIGGALQPDTEEAIYLLEDALELLAAVVAQTPTDGASPELLNLVPRLYPIYQLGTEGLAKVLEITDAFVVLAPAYMLSNEVRPALFKPLSDLVGEVKDEANGPVCNIVEGVIRAAAMLGSEQAVAQTASDLVQAGFLPKILKGLHGSWTAHCTTGPRAERAPVDGIVETDYFAILARLVIASVETFCQVCQTTTGASLEDTLKWLLEEWFSHFENIGDPSRRKLMCMALTKLLTTNQPSVLLSLQSLMAVWTDVVTELREDAASDTTGAGGNADSLVYTEEHMATSLPEGPEAPEDARRRALTRSDEVHTIYVANFIKHHLQQAIADTPGGEAQFQEEWIANVDRDVLKAFSDLGIM